MKASIICSLLAIPHPSPARRSYPAGLRAARGSRRQKALPCLRASSADGGGGDSRRDADPVDVITIGSRKDAVIDFCLASASSSSRARFWTIHTRDSVKVQLLQRCLGADMVLKDVDFPLSLHPCPPALILVASAGHGLDHIIATELLQFVKSEGGLTVAILLRPFSFEGQRRQEEVDDLVIKLRECSNFFIVVEAASLLKKEVETLAEALDRENTAVFMAINTVSILISEGYLKLLCTQDGQIKEVKSLEVLKLLESYREAKVGFGAAYNIRGAIMQAVSCCPFLNCDIKDLNGCVIFTLASASDMNENDMVSAVSTFRRITGWTEEIIFSRIHEPNLEPSLIVITLLIVGCCEMGMPRKKSFLSGLAQRFPLFFSLLGMHTTEQTADGLDERVGKPLVVDYSLADDWSMSSSHLAYGAEYLHECPEDVGTEPSCKDSSFKSKRSKGEFSDVSRKSSSEKYNNQANEEEPANQGQQQNSWNTGPGYYIAQLWARERAAYTGTNNNDKLDVFTIPVGVKSPEWSQYSETVDSKNRESVVIQATPSMDDLTSGGFEAITDIYNSASTLLKGKYVDETRKRGLLSSRAASMLEAEKESQKNWSPARKIQYRGGNYEGRCQGGLPEGKGRLTFVDGSFYNGMWRYGKRSGPGTLCYSNGDVFQGVWRDDLMHGKGWFYFHTGDRWFANFWKGKANGEGRYYSKDGSVFFGHFRNGWRHGQSLCIDADGVRWAEMWDEGVLVSRTQLEKEISG